MLRKTIVVALLLAGCEKAPQEDVFVVVDGRAITETAVSNIVLVQARMLELSGRKVDDKIFGLWANRHATEIIPGLISSELLQIAAEKEGVKPTQDDFDETLAKYNRSCGRAGLSLEELAKLFGEVKEPFLNQFERSKTLLAYGRKHFVAEVSESDVSSYLARMTNRVEYGRRIDARARKNADDAYARLKKGESWEAVAKDCSEDTLIDEENEDFYKTWVVTDLAGFGYEALAAALPTLKAGDISKPIEIDEGLVIVKVNSIEGGKYDLGRIIFRMAEPVEIPTPEAARRILQKEMSKKAQVECLADISANARMEYPKGTNFVVRIWK